MREALYYSKIDEQTIRCELCPHNCILAEGKRGICRVRKNYNGKLFSENYSNVCSLNFDPIEKKPLYHYFPGSTILSVGSVGCNLSCKFCQNWHISQTNVDDYPNLKNYSAEEIVKIALQKPENTGIAYTYNEPIVWYEYMFDIAKLAHENNLKNVMVTNGFINKEPLSELINYIDAFSVDLKAFSESFYKNLTSSKLEPVKNTLKFIKEKGKHLEITNLVITELNDDEIEFEKMVKWISNELGEDTAFHISRYFPAYKLNVNQTSPEKLSKLFEIANKHLNYVYLGNIITGEGQNTYCKNCKTQVINRQGYFTKITSLDKNGYCKKCKTKIINSES